MENLKTSPCIKLSVADLIRSVLPWPFHKDLPNGYCGQNSKSTFWELLLFALPWPFHRDLALDAVKNGHVEMNDPGKLTPFQLQVFDFVKTRPSTPGNHCAVNAFWHLKRAWMIREIDPEMAYFRCGCAEEEAATAIFHSLKRLRYANCKKINFRNHLHKLSVHPFLWTVYKMTDVPFQSNWDPIISITEEGGKPTISWSFILPTTKKRVKPEPPFNFFSKVDGEIYDFSRHIDRLKDIGQVETVLDYLKTGPNNRNMFLYAASNGRCRMREGLIDDFIRNQLANVVNMLIVYLLIDTYEVQQSFVQQCLNAFVKMLGQIPDEVEIETTP